MRVFNCVQVIFFFCKAYSPVSKCIFYYALIHVNTLCIFHYAYYRGKRDLLQRQKRPIIEAKETYYNPSLCIFHYALIHVNTLEYAHEHTKKQTGQSVKRFVGTRTRVRI